MDSQIANEEKPNLYPSVKVEIPEPEDLNMVHNIKVEEDMGLDEADMIKIEDLPLLVKDEDISHLVKNEDICSSVKTEDNPDSEEIKTEDFLHDAIIKSEELDLKMEDESSIPDHPLEDNKQEKDIFYRIDNKYVAKRGLEEEKILIYICHICNFETTLKTSLNSHQCLNKLSEDIKKYKCNKCNYKTTYRSRLRTHQLQHKKPSELKMLKCTECDYETIQKNDLKRHQLRHKKHMFQHKNPTEVEMQKRNEHKNPTEVEMQKRNEHKNPTEVEMQKGNECDYKMTQKSNLMEHQICHGIGNKYVVKRGVGEENILIYVCHICNFETTLKTSLYSHQCLNNHPKDIKIHKCNECDYKTNHKGHLKTHQLRHKKRMLLHKNHTEVEMQKPNECDNKTTQKVL